MNIRVCRGIPSNLAAFEKLPAEVCSARRMVSRSVRSRTSRRDSWGSASISSDFANDCAWESINSFR